MDSSISQYVTYGALLLIAAGLVYIYFTFSRRITELEDVTGNQSDLLAKIVTGRNVRPPPPPKKEPEKKEIEEFMEDDRVTEKTFKEE